MSDEKNKPNEKPADAKPVFFVRPGDDDADGDALADSIAEGIIAEINKWRHENGLPPLED